MAAELVGIVNRAVNALFLSFGTAWLVGVGLLLIAAWIAVKTRMDKVALTFCFILITGVFVTFGWLPQMVYYIIIGIAGAGVALAILKLVEGGGMS